MLEQNQQPIGARLAEVRTQIDAAADNAGLSGDDVSLIAVSKTHPAEKIEQAIAAGQRHFGENRVQEAQQKWPALKEAHPDMVLHLIGGLQSNKVKDAVALFDVIHSVDRPKLARAIARHAEASGRSPRCFIQVNTGEEPQKGGVLPADVEALVTLCRDDLAMPLEGLMCIPPADEAAALHFAFLRTLAQRNGLKGLSMGMSGDYELAVEMGATHVRVGTAIFGPRGTLT